MIGWKPFLLAKTAYWLGESYRCKIESMIGCGDYQQQHREFNSCSSSSNNSFCCRSASDDCNHARTGHYICSLSEFRSPLKRNLPMWRRKCIHPCSVGLDVTQESAPSFSNSAEIRDHLASGAPFWLRANAEIRDRCCQLFVCTWSTPIRFSGQSYVSETCQLFRTTTSILQLLLYKRDLKKKRCE